MVRAAGADNSAMRHRILPSIALVLALALVAWAGKEFAMPRAFNAKTYPARDEHPLEKVTIAADPYDMPDKASIFTIKYAENEFLPVHVIITNDGDEPISLGNMKAEMIFRDRSRSSAAADGDILRRITVVKQRGGQIPQTYPIPFPKKSKGGIPKGALDELDRAQFKAKAVEPHTTQSGFMFFDISGLKNPLSGARLIVTDIKDNHGNDLMYFEIPMEKYLSYTPPKGVPEQK